MIDSVETTDEVTAAIEKLLSTPKTQAPVEETPEPQPKPQPVQETEGEPEAPVDPDNAVVEGDVLQTSEPDKPRAVETKAPETAKEASEADKSQDAHLAQLNTLIPALQHAIAGEFRDIKTFEDLQRVASEDPSRYNRYVIHQAQLQHAQTEQQKLQMAAHGKWYQTEQEKLAKALPEIMDPEKGPRLRDELRAYAKKQGYSDQQIAFASSHDVQTLHKAMQFEKWQAEQKAQAAKVAAEQAKAKDKAAKAPPVSKPGVATDERKTKAQERYDTFRKTGKHEDLAALLQESGLA